MNRSFYIGITMSLILQALVLFGPLGGLLHIHKVATHHMITIGLASLIIPIATSEIHKWWTR